MNQGKGKHKEEKLLSGEAVLEAIECMWCKYPLRHLSLALEVDGVVMLRMTLFPISDPTNTEEEWNRQINILNNFRRRRPK